MLLSVYNSITVYIPYFKTEFGKMILVNLIFGVL